MWKTSYRIGILTASDKGAAGQRKDVSGSIIQKRMKEEGGKIVEAKILPDEEDLLVAQLHSWGESGRIDLILTTGGTGLSPRDRMPEATLKAADRIAPGFSEAIRAYSMSITPRGMLSRGVSAICKNTLIINLPGSPKAVSESLDVILPALEHGLDILCQKDSECGKG